MDFVWLEAECSRYEFFGDVVAQTHPDVGIVCVDDHPDKALSLIENLRRVSTHCSILVVSSSTDGRVILQAMRAGAKEFISFPVKIEELIAALNRIRSLSDGSTTRPRNCSVITVAGASGGVGTTSLAVNLACRLAADENNSVVLIDLDLALGDADVFLDAIPDYTLADVAQNISRLDFALLKRSLTKHTSGLYLLPRPVQLQDVRLITLEDMERVLGLLKATFTHLVLDVSKSFSELDFVAMRSSDTVLLVSQLDLPCLRNIVRLMMSFEETEGLTDKIRIIVNRVGMDSGQISLKKAQETMGRELYWQLPNDYQLMSEARNNGVPLQEQSPKAGLTLAINSLADAVASGREIDSTKAPQESGSSGLGRFFGFLSKPKSTG
jgi:pilus assembly protein CpaE